VLSRNPRRQYVNILTLLSAVCVASDSSAEQKSHMLIEVFQMGSSEEKRPVEYLSATEATMLVFTVVAAMGVVAGVETDVDLHKVRGGEGRDARLRGRANRLAARAAHPNTHDRTSPTRHDNGPSSHRRGSWPRRRWSRTRTAP